MNNTNFKDREFKARTAGGDSERLTYVSTGDDILDLLISNRKNGGVPSKRYLMIYSDSGLGKSLLQKVEENSF